MSIHQPTTISRVADSQIRIAVPPDTRFVALARVTAVSLGAELDFDVDALEELRIAANEVAAIMLERAEDAGATEVALCFTLLGDTAIELIVTVDDAGADSPIEPDPLAEQILASVADEFELRNGWARMLKRRP